MKIVAPIKEVPLEETINFCNTHFKKNETGIIYLLENPLEGEAIVEYLNLINNKSNLNVLGTTETISKKKNTRTPTLISKNAIRAINNSYFSINTGEENWNISIKKPYKKTAPITNKTDFLVLYSKNKLDNRQLERIVEEQSFLKENSIIINSYLEAKEANLSQPPIYDINLNPLGEIKGNYGFFELPMKKR